MSDLSFTVTLDDSSVKPTLARLERGFQSLSDRSKLTNRRLQRMNDAMERCAGALERANERATRQTSILKKLESSYNGLGHTMMNVTMTLGMMQGAFESMRHVLWSWQSYILKTTSDLEKMRIMMQQLSTEADPLTDSMEQVKYIMDFSKNAPYTIDALRDSFVKLKVAGLDPAKGSLKALVDANAAFGGSSDQLNRATVAIQQMQGKNVVSLEELRQQLGESIPQAMELMARGLGVSIKKMTKHIELGRLASQPAIEAMLRQFEINFGGSAERLMATYEGQIAKFDANMKILASTAAQEGGYYDAVVEALQELNQFLESPAAKMYAKEMGEMLKDMVIAFKQLTISAYENKESIAAVAKALAYLVGLKLGVAIVAGLVTPFLKLASVLGKLGTLFRGTSTQAGLLSRSFAKLRGAFSAFNNVGLRLQVLWAHLSANLAIFKASIPSLATVWSKFLALFSPTALVGATIFLGKIAAVAAAIYGAKKAVDYAIERFEVQKALDTTVADRVLDSPAKATTGQRDQLLKNIATLEKEVYRLNLELNGKRLEAFRELKAKELEITVENLKKTKAYQESDGIFMKMDVDSIVEAAQASENLAHQVRALAEAEAQLTRNSTNSQLTKFSTELSNQMATMQNAYNMEINRLKEEYNKAVSNEQGLELEAAKAHVVAVQEQMREAEIRLIEDRIAIKRNAAQSLISEIQSINAKERDAYKLTPADKARKTGLSFYVKNLLNDVIKYEDLIERIQAAVLGELPTINDGVEAEETALGKVVKMMGTKLNSMNIQLARAKGTYAGFGKNVEVAIEYLEQMGNRLDENGNKLSQHSDFVEVAQSIMQAAKAQDAYDASVKSSSAFKRQAGEAERFVEQLGYIKSKIRNFESDYARSYQHFANIANGSGFTAEQVANARNMMRYMESVKNDHKEMMVTNASNSLFNRHAKDLVDIERRFSKALPVDQLIANYDERISAAKQAMQRIIESETVSADVAAEAQRRLTEIFAIEADARADYIAQALDKSVKSAAPMLSQLEKQMTKKGDWSSQKTRKGKLDAFNEQMQIEIGRLEAQAAMFKVGTEEWQAYQDRLSALTEAGEQKRAEIAKGAFAGIVEEYADVASLMENTMANALNGIADATMDFMMTGEDNWRDFANNVIKEIGRIVLMKQVISPLANGLNGLIDSFVGGFGSRMSLQGSANALPPPDMTGPLTSTVIPAGFAGSRSLGMPSPQAAGFSSPDLSRNALGSMSSTVGSGSVEVNLINNTGEKATASAAKPRFDGRKMILDVVLEAANKPGGFRDGMKGALS